MSIQFPRLQHVDIRQMFGGWSIQILPHAQAVVVLDEHEMKFLNRDDKEFIDKLPEPWRSVVKGAFAYPEDEITGLWLGYWQIDLVGEPEKTSRDNIASLFDKAVDSILNPPKEQSVQNTSTNSPPSVFGRFAPIVAGLQHMRKHPEIYATATLAAPRTSLINLPGTPTPGSHRDMICHNEIETPGDPQRMYYHEARDLG